jgi:hypothetical protein
LVLQPLHQLEIPQVTRAWKDSFSTEQYRKATLGVVSMRLQGVSRRTDVLAACRPPHLLPDSAICVMTV